MRRKLFTSLLSPPPFFLCLFWIILSMRSEEVLLFFCVWFLFISKPITRWKYIYNPNVTGFCFFFKLYIYIYVCVCVCVCVRVIVLQIWKVCYHLQSSNSVLTKLKHSSRVPWESIAKKNKITWKKNVYLMREITQMSMHRNLRKRKITNTYQKEKQIEYSQSQKHKNQKFGRR